MHDHLERELKLDAPADFSLARLPEQLDGYIASAPRLQRLHTFYYDTRDRRLSRWGCSLRYRFGEGWTLKLSVPSGGSGLARVEHVFPGDAQTVPAAALDLATPYVRGEPVAHVAELRTVRASRDVRSANDNALAQIVEDDVRVVTGRQVSDRFRQVEIELADGAGDSVLDALAAMLRKRGAGRPNPIPKDVRALGRDPSDVAIPRPQLDRGASILDVAKASFSHAVERIVRNDAAIRLRHDSEAVHKARTSVRRLRSVLRTFEPAFETAYARARRALAVAWRCLGRCARRQRAAGAYRLRRAGAPSGRCEVDAGRPNRSGSRARLPTNASYTRCDNPSTSSCSTPSSSLQSDPP